MRSLTCVLALFAISLHWGIVLGSSQTTFSSLKDEPFKAFITPVPTGAGSLGIKPLDSYQSSNSEVLWMESNTTAGGDPYRYGYDPAQINFVSQQGIYRNEFNSTDSNTNHIDQSYFDRTTGYIVELEEDSAYLGAPYFIVVRQANGSLVWQNKTFHVHRDTYGGIGVLNGTVVILHYSSRGKRGTDYVQMVAFDILTGSCIYEKEYWQQTRCNPRSGICVSIAHRKEETSFVGFRASTGERAWTHHIPPTGGAMQFVVGSVWSHFLVMTDALGQYYSIDCNNGKFRPIGEAFSAGTAARYGPNLVREARNVTSPLTVLFQVFSIATGKRIIQIDGGHSTIPFYANDQVVVIDTLYGSKFDFYDAITGTLIKTIDVGSQVPGPYNVQPFLVGSSLIVPFNATTYQILNPLASTSSSRGEISYSYNTVVAAMLNSNFVYNRESTVMWTSHHVIQFSF